MNVGVFVGGSEGTASQGGGRGQMSPLCRRQGTDSTDNNILVDLRILA